MPAHRRNISREIRGARNTGVKKVNSNECFVYNN